MKIDMKMNLDEMVGKIDEFPITPFIQKSMKTLGIKTETNIKEIINNFVNDKGHKQGVDSGAFRDSVHLEMSQDGLSFRVADGVPYGIYHETGTKRHWLPFFDRGGKLTSLGQWAVRHFSDIGFTVTGKKGKSIKRPGRDQRLEVLKKKRGMYVSLDKMEAFQKSLAITNRDSAKVFEDTFDNILIEDLTK